MEELRNVEPEWQKLTRRLFFFFFLFSVVLQEIHDFHIKKSVDPVRLGTKVFEFLDSF